MPLEIPELRTIRVWIELNLIEGEDFNSDQRVIGDETAREMAEAAFILELGGIDPADYVQSSIQSLNNT